MSTSHQQILAYCKDMPMAKAKDYSYPCRQQIEADCLDLSNNKACDLLTKLKDAEKEAREKQIAAREKIKGTTFWCVVPVEVISPPAEGSKPVLRNPARVNEKISIKAGSFNIDDDLKWASKYSEEVKSKMQKLISLADKIRQADLPVSCSQDDDCRVQGVGDKGCGGYVSSVYYSVNGGSPSVISDIQSFNQQDDELNNILQFGSTCEYHMLYVPGCRENKCGASTTPLK